ncbi:MAG: UbiA family prenyltransferase, partial [Pseudomonadota bacterium]
FAVIFLWTPPHFWALALWRARDYRDVSVPMLPVVAGDAATRRQILAYTVILAPVAIGAAFTEAGGPIYFVVATLASLRFLVDALAIVRRDEATAMADKWRAEKRLFGFSIYYLFALFLAFILDAVLVVLAGPVGWPVLF